MSNYNNLFIVFFRLGMRGDPPGDDPYCDPPFVGDVIDDCAIGSEAPHPETQNETNDEGKLQVVPSYKAGVSPLGKRASKHPGFGLPLRKWAKETVETAIGTYHHPIGTVETAIETYNHSIGPQPQNTLSPSKKRKTGDIMDYGYDPDL